MLRIALLDQRLKTGMYNIPSPPIHPPPPSCVVCVNSVLCHDVGRETAQVQVPQVFHETDPPFWESVQRLQSRPLNTSIQALLQRESCAPKASFKQLNTVPSSRMVFFPEPVSPPTPRAGLILHSKRSIKLFVSTTPWYFGCCSLALISPIAFGQKKTPTFS